MQRQKLRDAAFVLPFLGLMLFMPPFVGVFFSLETFGGIPRVMIYLFGSWALLIALGFLLSRRMARAAEPGWPEPHDSRLQAGRMQAGQVQDGRMQDGRVPGGHRPGAHPPRPTVD